jgi:hypothetical protein
MRDPNDSSDLGRGTTSSKHQTDEVQEPEATHISGPWAGARPIIIQTTAPMARPEAGAGTVAVTSQAPSRNSYLTRLVEAVQNSRRFQAAPKRRQFLRLVQKERQ